MAGLQQARDYVRAEGIAEWMERRGREVAARGPEAELAGRIAWADGSRAGEFPYAPRPSDVVTLGAHSMQQGGVAERTYTVAGNSTIRPASSRVPKGWTPAPVKVRSVAHQPTATAKPRTPAAVAAPRSTPEDELQCSDASRRPSRTSCGRSPVATGGWRSPHSLLWRSRCLPRAGLCWRAGSRHLSSTALLSTCWAESKVLAERP